MFLTSWEFLTLSSRTQRLRNVPGFHWGSTWSIGLPTFLPSFLLKGTRTKSQQKEWNVIWKKNTGHPQEWEIWGLPGRGKAYGAGLLKEPPAEAAEISRSAQVSGSQEPLPGLGTIADQGTSSGWSRLAESWDPRGEAEHSWRTTHSAGKVESRCLWPPERRPCLDGTSLTHPPSRTPFKRGVQPQRKPDRHRTKKNSP